MTFFRPIHIHCFSQEPIPHSWEYRNSLACTVEAGVHTCLKGSPGAQRSGFPPATAALLPGLTKQDPPRGYQNLQARSGSREPALQKLSISARKEPGKILSPPLPSLSHYHQSLRDVVGGVVNSFAFKLAFPPALGLP